METYLSSNLRSLEYLVPMNGLPFCLRLKVRLKVVVSFFKTVIITYCYNYYNSKKRWCCLQNNDLQCTTYLKLQWSFFKSCLFCSESFFFFFHILQSKSFFVFSEWYFQSIRNGWQNLYFVGFPSNDIPGSSWYHLQSEIRIIIITTVVPTTDLSASIELPVGQQSKIIC